MVRPEIWEDLDGAVFDSGSGITEWDRLISHVGAGNITISSNALTQAGGSPLDRILSTPRPRDGNGKAAVPPSRPQDACGPTRGRIERRAQESLLYRPAIERAHTTADRMVQR